MTIANTSLKIAGQVDQLQQSIDETSAALNRRMDGDAQKISHLAGVLHELLDDLVTDHWCDVCGRMSGFEPGTGNRIPLPMIHTSDCLAVKARELLERINAPAVATESPTLRATERQFLAEFFSKDVAIDYSALDSGDDWTAFVDRIAEYGRLLDTVVVTEKAAGGRVADWYGILTESSDILGTSILSLTDYPDHESFTSIFTAIVQKHLEK